jgi:hypothetical protein
LSGRQRRLDVRANPSHQRCDRGMLRDPTTYE